MKSVNKGILAAGLLIMAGAVSVYFVDQELARDVITNPLTWFGAVTALFLIIATVATMRAHEAVKYFIAKKEGLVTEPMEEEVVEPETADSQSWVQRLLQKLQDSKPVEAEEEIDLRHDYDGISELDNNLPPWWLYGFYASIIFSVIYMVRYHITESAPLQIEEYEIEMAEAAKAKEEYLKTAANIVDETTVTVLTEGPKLQAGAKTYEANCAVCHAPDGGGGVGPNLADEYWLHGGSIGDVFGTIKYGVPSKGMIPWKDQLSPAQIQEVASYILSLQGTQPGDPKEAEGDLYQPPLDEEATAEL